MVKIRKLVTYAFVSSIAIFGLTGCGGGAKFYSIKNDFNTHIKKDSNIGIIADSCISVDGIGDDGDMFSITKSKEAANASMDGLKKAFDENGLKVNYTDSKSVCAYFKKPSLNVNISLDDEKIIKGNLPYFTEQLDIEYENALKDVLQTSYLSAVSGSNFQKTFLKSENIEESLEVLKRKTNQNKILILNTFGKDVKFSKSLAQGLVTGVLTLGLYSSHDVDFMKLYAVLIDLDKKEAIWSSAMSYKKPDMYDNEWYKDTYYNKTVRSITDNL